MDNEREDVGQVDNPLCASCGELVDDLDESLCDDCLAYEMAKKQ